MSDATTHPAYLPGIDVYDPVAVATATAGLLRQQLDRLDLELKTAPIPILTLAPMLVDLDRARRTLQLGLDGLYVMLAESVPPTEYRFDDDPGPEPEPPDPGLIPHSTP